MVMAMASLGRLYFVSFIFTILIPFTVTLHLIAPFCIHERGNYTNGSMYEANLNSLLTSFSNTTVAYGFYHSSAGGEVTGIGLYRGDVGPEDCRSCMNTSSHELRRVCPNSKEAIIYYDVCTLRYSNRSILGNWELNPNHQQPNSEYFWDVNGSTQALTKLLRRLQNEAASGGNIRKYATGEDVDFDSIYAAVQCSPDIPEQQCSECLDEIFKIISVHMKGKRGGKVVAPSCNFRFEIYPFYDPLPPDAPSPSPSSSPSPTNFPPLPPPTTGNGMHPN